MPAEKPENLGADLSAYLDGELPPGRAREVERVLAGSPELREELAQLRGVSAALAGLPRVGAPAELRRTLMKSAGLHRHRAGWVRWTVRLAAAAVIAGGLAVGWETFRGRAEVGREGVAAVWRELDGLAKEAGKVAERQFGGRADAVVDKPVLAICVQARTQSEYAAAMKAVRQWQAGVADSASEAARDSNVFQGELRVPEVAEVVAEIESRIEAPMYVEGSSASGAALVWSRGSSVAPEAWSLADEDGRDGLGLDRYTASRVPGKTMGGIQDLAARQTSGVDGKSKPSFGYSPDSAADELQGAASKRAADRMGTSLPTGAAFEDGVAEEEPEVLAALRAWLQSLPGQENGDGLVKVRIRLVPPSSGEGKP